MPCTASVPIEPPGKRSGRTTKVSVVSARRWPSSARTAASPSGSLEAAEERRDQALDQPPAGLAAGAVRHLDLRVVEPDPRLVVGHARSTVVGSARPALLPRLAVHVVVVGGAGAFGRHHQRADRLLGRALLAEQLAVLRLEHALEHLAALRRLGVGDANAGHLEARLGVPPRVLVADLERRLRDEAEPAPLEVGAQLEHLGHRPQRRAVALPGHHPARTGSRPRRGRRASWRRIMTMPCSRSSGSKPEVDDRLAVVAATNS